MRYSPYDIPDLGNENVLGVFAPGDEGFLGLERTLDLFRSEGVSLVIQLGEALLPRGTARSSDVDYLRRRLGERQQALLVCSDDLGRAENLRRSGVRGTDPRMVRHNITHLDPGFRTQLVNGVSFLVIPNDPSADRLVAEESFNAPKAHQETDSRGGIALAALGNHLDPKEGTRQLPPSLSISAGFGEFRDDPPRRQGPQDGASDTRVIIFGQRAGQYINHAIVHLPLGTVTLLPESSPRSRGRADYPEQLESS
ncbi:hypothetical protein ACVXZ4_10030 [Lacisediminihabitans sp. FW035]